VNHVKDAKRSKRIAVTLSTILVRKAIENCKPKQTLSDRIRSCVAHSIRLSYIPEGLEDLPTRQRYWRRNYRVVTISVTEHVFQCLSEFAAGFEMSISEAVEYHYWRFAKDLPE
jgi:hypothetical protein